MIDKLTIASLEFPLLEYWKILEAVENNDDEYIHDIIIKHNERIYNMLNFNPNFTKAIWEKYTISMKVMNTGIGNINKYRKEYVLDCAKISGEIIRGVIEYA